VTTPTEPETLESMYTDRPLIFGHRGASAYAPMNTLLAFQLAADLQADGVELDVQLTRDGELVVIHDITVDATTDGSGTVAEMTLAEIKALDAGSWFGPGYTGLRVPTLDEVFEAVAGRLLVNVEIKSMALEPDGLEEAVATCIERHHMAGRVVVSSFNPLALIRFRQAMPQVALGYLYAEGIPAAPDEVRARMTTEASHPHHEMLNADSVRALRDAGQRIHTWTVNDPARALVLRDLGVDITITDKPDLIRHAFWT